MIKVFQKEVAGRILEVEIGKLAQLSDGACLLRYGKTVVLVSACASSSPREGIDFFPLSVDYEEKMYAAGKIPGGFIKREGRPSENAILTCRLIDRPIRPLFPEGYRNEVQVIATVLSVDLDCSPDIVAMIGSSIALSISSIPFQGPTASVSVGMINGQYIINPTSEEREKSELDLVVSGTKDAVMMIEAGANEITEDQILGAILFAHEEIKNIISFIEEIVAEVGKEKQGVDLFDIDANLDIEVRKYATQKIANAIRTDEKLERTHNIELVKDETLEYFANKYEDDIDIKQVNFILDAILKEETRHLILYDKIRPDNRKYDEIRPISTEVSLLPKVHGSGLFTRGQTQVLSAVTLGAISDVQIIDGLGEEESKRYMHHYNFPPFCVGEVRFLRGPGRREIGHGALAGRALEPMIPSQDDFPYVIRVVSEVLSSNGSSSQASVCSSTLSLLDAGVPIKDMVAGIAMDLKVAGTSKGITAMQMDIKIKGIEKTILEDALEQARVGRLYILDKMKETISSPRPELSPYAPRMLKTKIHPDKIREVIGTGGKTINKIIDDTGVKIDIENDGTIFITALTQEAAEDALEKINDIIRDPEVGDIYKGKVMKIMNFGAFVEILPGKEGLVHISNIAHERINKVEDVLAPGDEIEVKVIEIDRQGKIGLSMKALLPRKNNRNNKNHKK